MDSDIPEAFIQVMKCSTSDILDDGKTVIGLCTTSRQLLEFVDKKVVDSCDIDKDATAINTFTSYDPLQKYYLICCQKDLIVVKRSKPLCIIKTYEDVVEVKIEDRLRIGRPQVVIRTLNDREPIVTDFVGQLHSTGPHSIPLLTASLKGKLQEMNARVVKAHKLLQEKKSARFKALYRFTPHLQPPDSETQSEPKVLAWGPPFTFQRPTTQVSLLLSKPWRKVYNGKWIIGVPVFNTTTVFTRDIQHHINQMVQ